MNDLFEKYDQPVPRYTSYPSVPYWQDDVTESIWLDSLNETIRSDKKLSIYIHIPFCETLCTYCGCHQVITKNFQRGQDYVELVLAELELYFKKVPELAGCELVEMHLGGGTPTFLQKESLERLIFEIRGKFERRMSEVKGFRGSIEVDPRRTTVEQLKTVYNLGFRRVSLGVQDLNLKVQTLIHRVQPFETVQRITEASRSLGFHSVNFDLIYGLPQQTLMDVHHTIDKTLELMPDRIALYSMALVPWMRPAQRLFDENDLPKGIEKRALYETARERLAEAGYFEVGMDHFALKSDSLYKACLDGALHRNFMGYTEEKTATLLGLGVSSISQTASCYHQNHKDINTYKEVLGEDRVPTLRGHSLSFQDRKRSQQIREIMTRFKTKFLSEDDAARMKVALRSLVDDDLIYIDNDSLEVSERGRPFLRNICLAFDERMDKGRQEKLMFSHL